MAPTGVYVEPVKGQIDARAPFGSPSHVIKKRGGFGRLQVSNRQPIMQSV
jgi:hypothetical protein